MWDVSVVSSQHHHHHQQPSGKRNIHHHNNSSPSNTFWYQCWRSRSKVSRRSFSFRLPIAGQQLRLSLESRIIGLDYSQPLMMATSTWFIGAPDQDQVTNKTSKTRIYLFWFGWMADQLAVQWIDGLWFENGPFRLKNNPDYLNKPWYIDIDPYSSL